LPGAADKCCQEREFLSGGYKGKGSVSAQSLLLVGVMETNGVVKMAADL
jgi:hypothetical protein